MPALAFLAVAGSVLVALLFLADATLEKNISPAIVTSQRSGLPGSSGHADTIQVLTTTPAPLPDMTSQAVLSAQPKAAPDPAGRAAWAEVPENKRVMRPIDYQQNRLVDRLSIRGQ